MSTSATLRNVGMSAQKVRLVADLIRGKRVESAIENLGFIVKKSAVIVKKVVESAVANAEHNDGADVDDLFISEICVDEAPTLKRNQPRAKGRSCRILKRRCHIRVVVSAKSEKRG